MNKWCKEHHGESGLTQRVRESKVDMRQAELQLLQFVRQHCPDAGSAQLAGNSVHVDRMFMLKYMPELTAHLSFR
jgi:oligoribonuclease